MKYQPFPILLLALLALLAPAWAQEEPAAEAAEEEAPADIGWPREFATETHSVIVYQPQIDEWVDSCRRNSS